MAFQIKVENDDQDQDGQGGYDGGSHHGLIVITGVCLAGGQGRGRGGGGQGAELLHVGLDDLAVGEVGLQPDLVPQRGLQPRHHQPLGRVDLGDLEDG